MRNTSIGICGEAAGPDGCGHVLYDVFLFNEPERGLKRCYAIPLLQLRYLGSTCVLSELASALGALGFRGLSAALFCHILRPASDLLAARRRSNSMTDSPRYKKRL